MSVEIRCSRCGNHKPRSDFGNDYTRPHDDNRRLYCRECNNAVNRTSREGANGKRVYHSTWRDDIAAYPDLAPPPVVVNGQAIA